MSTLDERLAALSPLAFRALWVAIPLVAFPLVALVMRIPLVSWGIDGAPSYVLVLCTVVICWTTLFVRYRTGWAAGYTRARMPSRGVVAAFYAAPVAVFAIVLGSLDDVALIAYVMLVGGVGFMAATGIHDLWSARDAHVLRQRAYGSTSVPPA